MNILFLGTGAADWELKSENDMTDGERRYSSMLIDGHILLDAAPQSYNYATKLDVDFSKITACLISHTHSDHYNKEAFISFAKQSGHKIDIYCHCNAAERLGITACEKEYVNIVPLNSFDTFECSGYEIVAAAANHMVENSSEQPLHFIMKKDGKTYMCGGDGGMYTARTWEYMRTQCFDGILFDATVGDSDCDWRLGTHNSIPMLRLIVAAMREGKMINKDTTLVATHFAKTLHAPDSETKLILDKIGIKMAADGESIDL